MSKKRSVNDTLTDLAKEHLSVIYSALNKMDIGLSYVLNHLVDEPYNLIEEEIKIMVEV